MQMLLTRLTRRLPSIRTDAKAWYARGFVLYSMGQYIDGIDSFDKAIVINPDDANAWYARGFGQFKMGEYTDAIASYDKAIAINPDFTEARENREIALQRKE